MGGIVGLRSPVHCVLRRHKAGSDCDWEYKDCTAAEGEEVIFFIPIPDMLTKEQMMVATECPTDMRLGIVLVDIPHPCSLLLGSHPSYTEICMQCNALDKMVAVTKVANLVHYIVKDRKAMILQCDGIIVDVPSLRY